MASTGLPRHHVVIFSLLCNYAVVCVCDGDTSVDDGLGRTTKVMASLERIPYVTSKPAMAGERERVTFEGVDYEDERDHPRNKYVLYWKDWDGSYNYGARQRYYCQYEYLRCIRHTPYFNWICSVSFGEIYWNWMNECELDSYNCMHESPQIYYQGDGTRPARCEFSVHYQEPSYIND